MKTHLWCLWSGTKINAKMQISVHNKTLDLSTPQVMGILNVTPDSVYAGSRKQTEQEIAERTNQIILEGGKIIDVGAFSTGPGSADVSEEEELLRMRNGLAIVRREQPDALVSIDTFRPSVARMAVEEFGADIINDISEGRGYYNNTSNENAKVDVDANENEPSDILLEVARLQVPYILMSLQADLENTVSVFLKKIKVLNSIGVKDIILDPGYGFGKDIIAGGGGKMAGIKRYLDIIGIKPEETIAFGDAENDLDMIRFAGIGVAMGNAEESVKAVADYVTADIDDDGIEKALKHYNLI